MLFAWKLLCFLGRNGTVSQEVEESGMGRRRRRRLRQLLRLREGNAPRLSLLLPAVVRPDPSYPAEAEAGAGAGAGQGQGQGHGQGHGQGRSRAGPTYIPEL